MTPRPDHRSDPSAACRQERPRAVAGRLVTLVLILLLSACTARIEGPGPLAERPVEPRLISAGEEQGRGDSHPNRASVVLPDGVRLPVRSWLPKAGDTEAIVVALHGFTDYSAAFEDPGRGLAAEGIAVYAYDQRGFGETGQHGVWVDADTLRSDTATITRLIREQHPETPVYLLGESMGGAVVATAMAGPDPPAVDGVILVAPAVWGWSVMNPAQAGALRTVNRIAPGLRLPVTPFRPRASDNQEMLAAMDRDPLAMNSVRVDQLYGLVDLMEEAMNAADYLEPPVLVLHGVNDAVIPWHATQRFLRRLPPEARLHVLPDGHHTVLRDLKAESALAATIDWIEEVNRRFPRAGEPGTMEQH